MANYVYIAAGQDGFIASKEGGMEWLSAIQAQKTDIYNQALVKSQYSRDR